MFERKSDKVISRRKFIHRLLRNLFTGLLIILISLGIGMLGYHHFENLSWLDSYLNASMILGGMGEIDTLKTDAGKFFAGTYALFSGIIFLAVMVIVLAPLFHRFFHQFHLDEEKKEEK